MENVFEMVLQEVETFLNIFLNLNFLKILKSLKIFNLEKIKKILNNVSVHSPFSLQISFYVSPFHSLINQYQFDCSKCEAEKKNL